MTNPINLLLNFHQKPAHKFSQFENVPNSLVEKQRNFGYELKFNEKKLTRKFSKKNQNKTNDKCETFKFVRRHIDCDWPVSGTRTRYKKKKA